MISKKNNDLFEIPGNCLYFIKFFLMNVLIFTFFRFLFFINFYDQFKNIELIEILKSFFIGIKYDVYVIDFGIVLFFILGAMPYIGVTSSIRNRKIYSIVISFLFWILYVLEIGNIVFYKYCNTNLNFITIEYIKSFQYVFYMISKIFSIKLFLILIFVIYIYIRVFEFFVFSIKRTNFSFLKNFLFFLIIFLFLFLGIIEGLRQGILNWGEAFFSKYNIINQMTMNPIFYLSKDLYFSVKNKKLDSLYSYFDSPKDAEKIAKEIFFGNNQNNNFLFSDYPFYKEIKKEGEEKKYNVVIILLESFTAEYIGELGSDLDISPYFDQLSKNGALFTNFYSAGQRTNSGIASTLCSYVAIPGHSIMVRRDGLQKISSIASILKEKFYETAFIYGGDLQFDNMKNFLTSKGFDRVIGEESFNYNLLNKWGVEDKYVFDKSIEMMDKFYNNDKNFMLMVLSLTNHPPFTVPDTFDKKVDINKDFNDSYNTFKYTDYCLGQFFENIKNKPYFKDTIFVICGDHGQTLHYDLAFDYRKSYIPCLFYAPNIILPSINDKLTSQIDIAPTILNILNISSKNSFLGKDMFSEKDINKDFSFIVSGSDVGYLKNGFFYYIKIGSGKNGSLKKIGNFYDEYKEKYPEIFNLMNIETRAILESTYGVFKNRKIVK